MSANISSPYPAALRTQQKVKDDETVPKPPVRHSAEHSGQRAGGAAARPQLRAPAPAGWPISSRFAPAFPTPSRGRRERPARCPQGSAGSSARTQHQRGPGVCLPQAPTRVSHSGTGPTCLGDRHWPLLPRPSYLVMAQSEVRGGDAGESSRDSVSATDETLPRARGVPDPWKSCSDRPPREGVTIRSQEREPGPPLGPAVRRHQLHPRSGARPRLPRVGEERNK